MSASTITAGIRRARSGIGVAGRGARPGGRGRQRSPLRRARRATLFSFAAPAALILILINLYPLLEALSQSLRSATLTNPGSFVGLDNYAKAFGGGSVGELFWGATTFTVVFTVVGVFGSWVVGLAFALLLRNRFPFRAGFRLLLLLPWIVPTVVSAFAWNWLVATPQSPVPALLSALGLGTPLFLADPLLAQIVVCLFKVWISFPFMMTVMASALAGIDPTVYEAGRVDGAGTWQSFRHITLPLIMRPTYVAWVLMAIFCVNDFPTIALLTNGGPFGATTTLVVLAYQMVFQNFAVGQGVAIAFLTTLVLVVVSVVLHHRIGKAHSE